MLKKPARLLQKGIQHLKIFGPKSFLKKTSRKVLIKLLHKVPDEHQVVPMVADLDHQNWYYQRFPNLKPLKVFTVPPSGLRLNLVTDSINAGSLYGGVGTAIIFCALFARRLGCQLRVITRTEKAEAQNFFEILKSNKVVYKDNVEFIFNDIFSGTSSVDISTEDIFVTTSWWTTHASLQSIPAQQIVYLLQEDERMFYPYGDDHLLCSETLANTEIKFVINTQLLFDHFVDAGFENIRKNGVWFEPSFTSYQASSSVGPSSIGKKRFFFYARPNNLRNLFYLGLEVIETAVAAGVLNTDEWELFFVGKDLSALKLSEKLHPQLVQGLSWQEYVNFLQTVDVGLSLMYTPHPSYPPLDLAASGSISVTNQFGPKQDLWKYSKNIICKEATVKSLVQGIAEAVELSKDGKQRRENYENNTMLKDWELSFGQILETLDVIR
jgi:O-antigen biosynthesis protein